MSTITSKAKRYKSRGSRWTLALAVTSGLLVDLVTVVEAAAVDSIVISIVVVFMVVAVDAFVFIVVVVDLLVASDVVAVVADPRNKDGSTLCTQLYEIDVARPTLLLPMSKIE
jgi:hypothetical protein